MLLHELPGKLSDFCKLTPEKKFECKNNEAQDEYQQTDAVNAVHVFYEPCFRPVGIRFFNVEIFRNLL